MKKKRLEWPNVVDVPAVVAGFGGLRFLVDTPGDCEDRIRRLLDIVHDAGERWTEDTSVLLRCMQAHHGIDALLDALLELQRRQHDTPESLHATWLLSWPGTAAPSGDVLDAEAVA